MLSRLLARVDQLAYLGRRPLPPIAPLRDYWVRVGVRLEPELVVNDAPPLVGYYRVFGVRATPMNAIPLVAARVTDGVIIEQQMESVDVRSATWDLARPLFKQFGEGVWHESGRAFFPRWGE